MIVPLKIEAHFHMRSKKSIYADGPRHEKMSIFFHVVLLSG